MTIKELKEKIKDLPDHMDVFIEKIDDEFPYGLVESAEVKLVTFSTSEELEAEEDCLIISDTN